MMPLLIRSLNCCGSANSKRGASNGLARTGTDGMDMMGRRAGLQGVRIETFDWSGLRNGRWLRGSALVSSYKLLKVNVF
jgi:hypothetical protein